MKTHKRSFRAICSLLACAILFAGLPVSVAQAKMITTGEVINQAQSDMSRQQI